MDKNLKTHYAVYVSDTPVTLKQSQSHQSWNESVNPNQSYNHAKFKRPPLNSAQEKENVTFLSNQGTCQSSPLSMCKSKNLWYIHDLVNIIKSHKVLTKIRRIFSLNCLILL